MGEFCTKYIGFDGLHYCIQIYFKDKFSCTSFFMRLRELYHFKPIGYDDGRFKGNLMVEETKSNTTLNIIFLLEDDNGKRASELAHEELARQFINTQLLSLNT